MRIALALAIGISAWPAAADEASRRAVTEIVAEAGALGMLCLEQHWVLSKEEFKSLWITGNFVVPAVTTISARMSEKVDQLQRDKVDRSIICRDAREKFGPTGSLVPNLLVLRGDPRGFN